MAYVVIAPDGRTETLEAEITLTEEENGMVKIELTIEPTPTNQKFIKDINEFWVISGIKKSQYGKFYIKHLQRHGKGKWLTVTVEAVAEFIHVLQTSTFDGYYTGSRTAIEYFNILSQQSGLTIRPVDFMQAFGWEKFGLGVHNIKEFNRGLNNYGYTYEVKSPNIIELHTKEGREVQYMIKNAFNSDSMKMEIDTSETFTYIQGYADFDEEGNFYEDAKLYDDYEHPVLFDLLGKWEAETYTNQKINQLETLQKYLKDFVDNSIKYTITTNFKQLKDYPFAVPQLGDKIRVIDESININDTAKAVKIKTFYNKYNDVVDYEIDFGNLSVAQRVKASLDSVQSQMDALRDGREPVNIGMLDANVGAVIESFKESETEVRFGDYNGFKGLFLVDKNDPNQAMALFSKGIGITENAFAGGIDNNMAMTAKGLNISTVYTGTLWLENFLGIIGKDSWLELSATEFLMKSLTDETKFFRARPGQVTVSGMFEVLRDDGGYPTMIKGRNTVGERLQGMNPAFMQTRSVEITGQRYSTASNELVTVDAYYFDQFYRDIRIRFAFRNNSETEPYTVEYGASGFGNLTELNEIETIEVPPNETVYPSLDFHLGVPEGNQKQFYIKFASKTSGRNALMSIAYVKNLDLSKYDHL